MNIDSLAMRTDLFFHRFNGEIKDLDDYLVVKTPSNPTFFWGNFLFFKKAPDEQSFPLWKNLFKKEFSDLGCTHMAFSWDSVKGEIVNAEAFVKDGFTIENSSVLVNEAIMKPQRMNGDITVRPITNEKEWTMVLENHVLGRDEHFGEAPYRKFAARRISDYRKMIDRGIGVWMGAFFRERLVGDLGLFSEAGLARFQAVGTHPDFRRLGVCSTLLHETLLYTKEKFSVKQFVIVADPDYHAINIYRSVGFVDQEIQTGMSKFDKSAWVTSR